MQFEQESFQQLDVQGREGTVVHADPYIFPCVNDFWHYLSNCNIGMQVQLTFISFFQFSLSKLQNEGEFPWDDPNQGSMIQDHSDRSAFKSSWIIDPDPDHPKGTHPD